MISFGLGLLIGGLIIGIVARRKPEWFAKVIKVANAVDDKINDQIGG